eukprot:262852-Alexandrium_andersonii.AAC.1
MDGGRDPKPLEQSWPQRVPDAGTSPSGARPSRVRARPALKQLGVHSRRACVAGPSTPSDSFRTLADVAWDAE